MTETQRAEPAARREAVLLVVAGAVVGAVLLVVLERYRAPLREWLLSEPEQSAHRLKFVFLLVSVAMSAPLFGFAAHIWCLGDKVIRAQQLPPPRARVVCDAGVLRERRAVARGHSFKILAVFLAMVAAVMWCLLWRLASALTERAA
jgi:hypothetical protein